MNDETRPETPAPAPTETWLNIRWIALGAAILVAGVKLGNGLLMTHVVEKSAELAEAYQKQDAKVARGEELTSDDKSELRSVMFGSGKIVGGLAAMLLVLPFGIGVLVGRATGTVRNALIAVSAGMALGLAFSEVQALAVLIAAAIYALIGALAGLLGRRLARRRATA